MGICGCIEDFKQRSTKNISGENVGIKSKIQGANSKLFQN